MNLILKRNKHGHFNYGLFRHESESMMISLFQQTLNASTIYSVKDVSDCLKLTKEGTIDLILAWLPIYNITDYYHVPFGTEETYMNIITGYDYNKYTKVTKISELNKLGILCNYKGFDLTVYYFIVFTITTFIILAFGYSLVDGEKLLIRRKFKARRNHARRFCRIIARSYKIKSTKKFFNYLVMMATFFIVTPFFLLFNTNQLIVPPPKVLKDFKDAIEAAVKIYYSPSCGNPDDFIVTKSRHILDYYKKNKVAIKLPDINNLHEFHYKVADIIEKRAILLVPKIETDIIFPLVCSWSKDDQLNKIKVYKSEHTRQFVAGMVFHRNYTNPRGFKNFLTSFERGLHQTRNGRFYVGFGFISRNPKHIKDQMILCDNMSRIERRKSKVYNGSYKLFSNFFNVCLRLLLFSTGFLMFEIVIRKILRHRQNYIRSLQNSSKKNSSLGNISHRTN